MKQKELYKKVRHAFYGDNTLEDLDKIKEELDSAHFNATIRQRKALDLKAEIIYFLSEAVRTHGKEKAGGMILKEKKSCEELIDENKPLLRKIEIAERTCYISNLTLKLI